jgi:hypothetical protein
MFTCSGGGLSGELLGFELIFSAKVGKVIGNWIARAGYGRVHHWVRNWWRRLLVVQSAQFAT